MSVSRAFAICDPTGAWWSDLSLYAALTLFGIQWMLAGVAKTPYIPTYVRRIGFLHVTLYWFLGALLQELFRLERPRASECLATNSIWNRSLNIWAFPDILYVSPASMSLALLIIDAFICARMWQYACPDTKRSWWRYSGYATERGVDWIFWILASVAYWVIEFLLERTTFLLALINWIATLFLAALSFGIWYGVQHNLQNTSWMAQHLDHFYHPHNTHIDGVWVERVVRTRARPEIVENVTDALFAA